MKEAGLDNLSSASAIFLILYHQKIKKGDTANLRYRQG
jgi:hypothetical protein